MTHLTMRRWLQLLGPFIGLALVLVVFAALTPDRFFSAYNVRTMLTQTVVVGLPAIGMTYVIASGGIDLSIGSVIALTSVVIALVLRDGYDPSLAVLAGVCAGVGAGLLNGMLVTRLRIVPFIVTLGTMQIARGFAKFLSNEQKVNAPPDWLRGLMAKAPDQKWLLVAPAVWITLAFAVVSAFILHRTVFGVRTIAVGSNEATARLCGIRVDRMKLAAYGIGGLFAGLAGVMEFSKLTVGDPTIADGTELDVIAAVVIGGGSLNGGTASVLGSLVGAALMAVLAHGCTMLDLPNYVQEIVVGIIIIVAVYIDRLRRERESAQGQAPREAKA